MVRLKLGADLMHIALKVFTFHYGKIETELGSSSRAHIWPLHSTMVRLKHDRPHPRRRRMEAFTFHYGKIETASGARTPRGRSFFTFHYGKIETLPRSFATGKQASFTFHYGKIETRARR